MKTQKIYILNTSAQILRLRKVVFITNKCPLACISDVCRKIFSDSVFTGNVDNTALCFPELYKNVTSFDFKCALQT
jgi:hypothetical protein